MRGVALGSPLLSIIGAASDGNGGWEAPWSAVTSRGQEFRDYQSLHPEKVQGSSGLASQRATEVLEGRNEGKKGSVPTLFYLRCLPHLGEPALKSSLIPILPPHPSLPCPPGHQLFHFPNKDTE